MICVDKPLCRLSVGTSGIAYRWRVLPSNLQESISCVVYISSIRNRNKSKQKQTYIQLVLRLCSTQLNVKCQMLTYARAHRTNTSNPLSVFATFLCNLCIDVRTRRKVSKRKSERKKIFPIIYYVYLNLSSLFLASSIGARFTSSLRRTNEKRKKKWKRKTKNSLDFVCSCTATTTPPPPPHTNLSRRFYFILSNNKIICNNLVLSRNNNRVQIILMSLPWRIYRILYFTHCFYLFICRNPLPNEYLSFVWWSFTFTWHFLCDYGSASDRIKFQVAEKKNKFKTVLRFASTPFANYRIVRYCAVCRLSYSEVHIEHRSLCWIDAKRIPSRDTADHIIDDTMSLCLIWCGEWWAMDARATLPRNFNASHA